jgi:hypothetical protein
VQALTAAEFVPTDLPRVRYLVSRSENEQWASECRYRTELSSAERGRFRQALAGKVQNGLYFLWRYVENLSDLIDGHADLQILHG